MGGKAPVLRGRRLALRDKDVSDAVDDYAWRRDPELSRLDAASPLVAPYSDYLASFMDELEHLSPRKAHFALEADGIHIGNCSLFDIDHTLGQTELGIMVGDRRYWDRGYGSEAINLLLGYAFTQLDLRRIYLYTLDWNIRAQRCFQKCGFKACSRMRWEGSSFVVMEIYREAWLLKQRQAVLEKRSQED